MPRSSFRRHMTLGGLVHPEIGMLIAASLVLSIVGAVGQRQGLPLFGWLAFVPRLVWQGQVWRLVTSIFIESDPLSLLFACLMLYWFGRDLSTIWGVRRFVSVYLGLAVVTHALTSLVAFADRDAMAYPYIGSWPLAEALVCAWAVAFPEREIRLYLVIPIRGKVLLYLTVGIVVLLAAYHGLTPFIPHLLAIFLMLVYVGALMPRRWYLAARNALARARRKARVRVRGSHLRPVRRGRPGDDEGGGRPPPKYWN